MTSELKPAISQALRPDDLPETVHVGKAVIRFPNGIESGSWYSKPFEDDNTVPFTRAAAPAPSVDPRSDPRVVRLVELLKEARDDIETYVDHDWPENLRAQYPTYQSKWNRDMDLCRRIDAAIAALEENK